jgi:hypothetical protein
MIPRITKFPTVKPTFFIFQLLLFFYVAINLPVTVRQR